MSYDLVRKLSLDSSGLKDQVIIHKRTDPELFCLDIRSQEPTDSYGIDWKDTQECVLITREELMQLKSIIEEVLK
jgi:hypothetical protein